MKRKVVILAVLVCVFMNNSPVAFGAGFQLPEQGVAAMGQANAFVGRADDASAVFYNPAGILQLEGTQAMLGTTVISPALTFKSEGTSISPSFVPPSPAGTDTDGEKLTFILPHLYVTHKINEKVGFGFGVFTPFGLTTEWPDDWEGRFFSYKAALASTYFNPVVAYEVQPGFTVSGGVQYVRSEVELRRKLDLSLILGPGAPEGNLSLKDATGTGWGFNLGALYKVDEQNSLGVSFRNAVKIDYEGDADFTVPAPVAALFPDGDAETTITMPSVLEVGWTNRSVQDLTLSLDLQWIGWSSFDDLNIDFITNTPAVGDSDNPRDWKNTLAIRLGAEYQTQQPGLVLRAGYTYDPTPVPDKTVDTLLPDSDRHDVSIGLGYKTGAWTIDVAYMAVLFVDRDVDNTLPLNAVQSYNQKGTYEGFAHIVAIGFNYSF